VDRSWRNRDWRNRGWRNQGRWLVVGAFVRVELGMSQIQDSGVFSLLNSCYSSWIQRLIDEYGLACFIIGILAFVVWMLFLMANRSL